MKKELRKWAKEKRATLAVDTLSSQIKENLFSSLLYKNAKNIMCYYSFGNEVNTVDFFQDSSKNWYLPKIEGDELLICPFCSDFSFNKYNILEPNTHPVAYDKVDMVIIPALCVDKN